MNLHINKELGFSLIELMVVVVIIGILAGVAIPSFTAYVENGRRAEGKAFALDIASRQERHFTQHSQYAGGFSSTASATNLVLPNGNTSENGNYTATIAVPAGIPTTYSISVIPAITDSTCGTLTLTNTGQRSVSTSTDVDVIARCWR